MGSSVANKDACLEKMPVELWPKFLDGIDFFSLQSLRKVSTQIREYVDSTVPESNLSHLNVSALPDLIYLDLKNVNNDSYMRKNVVYQVHKDGCLVTCGRKQALLRGQDIGEAAANDLVLLLKHQNGVLRYFDCEFPFSDTDFRHLWPSFDKFLETLGEYLKVREERIKLEHFHMAITQLEQVMTVLPFVDTTVLKRISIWRWSPKCKIQMHFKVGKYANAENTEREEVLNIDALMALEQFRSAKEICIDDFIVEAPLRNFFHFKKASILFQVVGFRDFAMLVNEFRRHDVTMEEMILRFMNNGDWAVLTSQRGEHSGICVSEDPERAVQVTFVPNHHFKFNHLPTFRAGE